MRYQATTLLLALASLPAFAQVPISGTTVYTQNFNSLPSEPSGTAIQWTNNQTLPGWFIHRSNASPRYFANNGTYYCADGSLPPNTAPFVHGHYNTGYDLDPDRSLSASSTTGLGEISTFVVFENTSASPVTLKNLAYTGKVYRSNQSSANPETTTVSYRIANSAAELISVIGASAQAATMPAAVGFQPFNPTDLNFTYDTGLDGDDIQVVPAREYILGPAAPTSVISLLPGQAIAVRWGNINDGGRDAIIGIDNVSVSFEGVSCAINAVTSNFTRDSKGTPENPNDDTYGFDLLVTGIGASPTGWQITEAGPFASTGTYRTVRTFSGLPVSTGSTTLTIRDRGTASCTTAVTVAPPVTFALIPVSGNATYTQNFNTLPEDFNGAILTWNNDTSLPGWYIHRSNATPRIFPTGGEYYAVDGSTPSNLNPPNHGHYSAGSDSDRGIAASPTTGLGEISTVAAFQNTSASAIRLKSLAYVGKIYRSNQDVVNLEPITVSYKIASSGTALFEDLANATPGATMPAAAGFQPVNSALLDFVYDSNLDGPDVHVFPPREYIQGPAAPANDVIILPGQTLALRWGNINDGGRDAIIGVDNVSAAFETVACAINPVITNVVRDLNGTPGNPLDDTFSYTLTVAGIGASAAGWEIVDPAAYATSGTYGTAKVITGQPIPAGPLTLTVRDRVTNTCSAQITLTVPLAERYVTDVVSQGQTFTSPPVGAQAYTRTDTGDIGFTGGNAASIVSLQPDPNLRAKYFQINNSRPTIVTDAVNITLVDSIRASVGLAAYTTSGTGLEADDTITVTLETTNNLALGLWTTAATLVDGATVDGVTLFNQIRVADPGINYPAGQPYPEADFPFRKFRSATVPRGTATHARLVVSGGNNSGSEFTLIDDMMIEKANCLITPTFTVIRDNKGDGDPANDEFEATVTVTAEANGASTGWVSDATPASGLYGVQTRFGPYLVSGGPRVITFTDNLAPTCKAQISIAPPPTVLTIDPITDLVRDKGASAATAADDRFVFTAFLTAVNGGSGWVARAGNPAGPVIGSGNYGVPVLVSLPTDVNQVVFSDAADPSAILTVTVDVSSADIALGLNQVGATPSVLYATPVFGGYWRQTGSNLPAGAPATAAGLYSAVLNNANSVGIPMETDTIDLSGTSGPTQFSATLVAYDNSAGSNFEGDDTFGLDLQLTLEGNPVPVTVQLVPLLPGVDVSPANGVINGYSYVDLADYNANRALDEFNRDLTAGELPLTSSFSFTYSIPKQFNDGGVLRNVISARAIVSAVNNSGSEFYYLKDVNFSSGGGAVDSDGDGLVDAWELQYFGNLSQNGSGDPDGDGQSNAAEQFAGTAPNNGTSVLAVTSVTRTGSNYSVTFNAVPGKKYAAEYATELNGQWIAIPGTLTATGASETVNGVLPTPAPDRIFIRIRAVP